MVNEEVHITDRQNAYGREDHLSNVKEKRR
jgi:hypothetical protein